MNNLKIFVLLGVFIGLLIGEFFPQLLTNGIESLQINFQGPFSDLRNLLALRFGFFGGLIGLVIGYIKQKSSFARKSGTSEK